MFTKKQLWSVVGGICMVCLMAMPAFAQQEYQHEGQGQEMMQGENVSDKMLEKAADAYVEIRQINNEFERDVQETEEPAERQELQNAANQKMIQAVEENGLEVASYNNIMKQIRMDQALGQRFEQLMEDKQ